MEHRTNETPLLQTIGLQKYFKVRGNSLLHAVDGIDLTLYSGQTLGVVGESGCGKSTLGRTILKLIEPTGGQILYNGKDITKLSTRKMHPYRKDVLLHSLRYKAEMARHDSGNLLPACRSRNERCTEQ